MARHDGGLTNEERAALQPHFDRPGTPSAPVVLPVVARLREYVQHKFACAKRSYEAADGSHAPLDPWLADKKPCTCGLDAAVAACLGEKMQHCQRFKYDYETPGFCKLCGGLRQKHDAAALTLSEGQKTNDDEGNAAPSGPRPTE